MDCTTGTGGEGTVPVAMGRSVAERSSRSPVAMKALIGKNNEQPD